MKSIHEGWITRNPAVMTGKPCIRGTRITVELILTKMSQGATVEELVMDYPHITKDAIYACLDYVMLIMKHEEVVELSA